MDVWSYLPRELRPPLAREPYTLAWRSDLGANASVGDIAKYLAAFQVAIDLGERWGLALAEEAAALSLRSELFAAGRGRGDVNLSPLGEVMPWHARSRFTW